MQSMIERVAQALFDAAYRPDLTKEPSEVQAVYEDMARAAIEAMREPTTGMTGEGVSHWATHDDAEEDVDGIWTAMIEEALRCKA